MSAEQRSQVNDPESASLTGHLFISYARKNKESVEGLVDWIKAAGRDVWVDLKGIPPIGDWLAEIQTAIDRADACLFFLSPEFAESKECWKEAQYAAEAGKRLV